MAGPPQRRDSNGNPHPDPPPTGGHHRGGNHNGGHRNVPAARTFFASVLQGLGAPVNGQTLGYMYAWARREGAGGAYNPLNTTQDMPGATSMNGVGVKNYKSWQDGVHATIKTMEQGYLGSLVAKLRTGNISVNDSFSGLRTWSGGSYDSLAGISTAPYVIYAGSGGTNPVGHLDGSAPPGSGTVTVNTPTPKALRSQPMSVKQYLDSPQIAQTYGYLAAYLHNKQIGPILAEAAKKGWGQDELLGALEKTKWWKNTAESTRSWQAQQRLDPATARQRLHQMQQQIQQLALSTLGSRLDPDRAAHMANAALSANWNQAQLQSAIGAEWHYQGAQAKYKGAAGQTVDQLQQLSQQFLVPVAHHEMQHWGRQILEGSTTVDDYKSYLQAQAESLYPTLTHALKSGQTVAQFADPYLQMASQILEKPVGDFNLFNPKWGKALNTVDDQGQRGPMSLADWGDYLRGLPDYRRTQQAQQQGAAFSNSLLNIFGKVSTPNSVPSAAVGP